MVLGCICGEPQAVLEVLEGGVGDSLLEVLEVGGDGSLELDDDE